MALEDFEKELAQAKSHESTERSSHRDRSRNREDKHRHRHHHRSHRHREDDDGERRHKRQRDREDDEERRHRKKRHRSDSPKTSKEPQEQIKVFDSDPNDEEEAEEWVEKEAAATPPAEATLHNRDQDLEEEKVHRDAWMQEPSALDIDYVQRKKTKPPSSQFVGATNDREFKIQQIDRDQHLADLEKDFEDSDNDEKNGKVEDEPAQHEVSYTFGDAGSSWRMTKLKAVYRHAEENGRSVDDEALKRYGDLRDFDDARGEERELDRREMYGWEYVGLEKPSGELFQERKMEAGMRRGGVESDGQDEDLPSQGELVQEAPQSTTTAPLDSTALNKLKAQLMKAKLRNDPNAAQLEEEYNQASQASLANTTQSDTVILNTMQNRHLAGNRSSEVKALSGKRARERGTVEENEDMSIDDMVRQEKRSKQGSGKELAERIAKDGKFTDNLDYMDDNAEKLGKKVVKSEGNLKNAAIGDFQRMQNVLSSCPLCYQEDSGQPPTAPVVSLATRTYLTLPTEPEVAKGGAVIVPIQHRLNLLECDDDEWEEIRNFMKSLTRYYDAQGKGVLFYENAAHMLSSRRGSHAALNVVPLPEHLAETAPAYFKEAILSSDEQWSQHQPLIDTQALTREYGKGAFRKRMVKEMPYFHVWFGLDGGLGHVVEDERRWPRGDLFAREVLGGMLDRGVEVVRRQGRWERGDRRVEGFRKGWGEWDWTRALMGGG